jgi:hypothetical protein
MVSIHTSSQFSSFLIKKFSGYFFYQCSDQQDSTGDGSHNSLSAYDWSNIAFTLHKFIKLSAFMNPILSWIRIPI